MLLRWTKNAVELLWSPFDYSNTLYRPCLPNLIDSHDGIKTRTACPKFHSTLTGQFVADEIKYFQGRKRAKLFRDFACAVVRTKSQNKRQTIFVHVRQRQVDLQLLVVHARKRQVDRHCWRWFFTFGKVEWECVVVGSVDAIYHTAGSRYTV